MPFEDTLVNTALDAMTPRIVSCSLHTADPGGTGANEVTGGSYARQTPSWAAAATAVVEIDTPMVFQVPAGNTVAYVGLWDTGPTWVGSIQLGSPEVFSNDGELTVQEMSITGTTP